MYMSSLIIKLLISAGMVLTVTLVAERASARFAGVLMGFPLGAGLVLFFIGVEQGPLFAAESALWSTQGILATLGFSWGYLAGIKLFEKETLLGLAGCVLLGLVGFFATAFCVRYLLPESFGLRSAILAFALAGCIVKFRFLPVQKIQGRIPLSPTLIGVRAGFSATIVLLVTGMAELLGSQWSGIFATFPTTVLPSVVVLQHHYGSEPVKTLFREFPLGLLAIIVFSLSISMSYPYCGVYLGTLLSYIVATGYLILYEIKLRRVLELLPPVVKLRS